MQGFERLGEFSRAVQASRAASAACGSPFVPHTDDLRFAEGMLFGVVLMLPFWLSLVWVIELLTR